MSRNIHSLFLINHFQNGNSSERGIRMIFSINGTIWHIEYKNPNTSELMRSDGTYTLGVTDRNTKTVTIANCLSKDMTDKVLCHELTHVHAMEYNYTIPIETEEIVADFLSLYGRDIIYLADDIMSGFMERKRFG